MAFDWKEHFGIYQHYDTALEPDIRLQLHGLYERTKTSVAKERTISLEVVLLIGCLEAENAAVNLGLGKRENLAKALGLSESQYWKRSQAGRVLVAFPQFIELIISGECQISHMSIIAAKITEDNCDIFTEELPGKSDRQVRELAASIGRDGSRSKAEPLLNLRLKFTQSQLECLDRAVEVLSATGRVPSQEEAMVLALEDLLEKRDPLRKAKRAMERKEKSAARGASRKAAQHVTAVPQSDLQLDHRPETVPTTAVPQSDLQLDHRAETVPTTAVPQSDLQLDHRAETVPTTAVPQSEIKGRRNIPKHVVHQIWHRDQGCCTFRDAEGQRCRSKIGVQVDHIVPVCFGHDNRPENLRLLCRQHNMAEAQRILGAGIMAKFNWIRQQTSE